jgi:hypothetical protein
MQHPMRTDKRAPEPMGNIEHAEEVKELREERGQAKTGGRSSGKTRLLCFAQHKASPSALCSALAKPEVRQLVPEASPVS